MDIFKVKAPKDFVYYMVFTSFVICEFLPILNLLNPIILFAVKASLSWLFYYFVYQKDRKLFHLFIFTTILSIFSTIIAYHNVYMYISGIGKYLIGHTMCFIYMQIGIFLMKHGSSQLKNWLRNTLFGFAIITAMTSLLVLQKVPVAVRELDNGSGHIKGMETILYSMNTATWGLLYGMVFLLPIAIIWFKYTKNIWMLFWIGIVELLVFKSQLSMAILFSAVFLTSLFIKPMSPRKLTILGLICLASKTVILDILAYATYYLYDLFRSIWPHDLFAYRLHQLHLLFAGQQVEGTVGARFSLYEMSLQTFLENPILGYTSGDVFQSIGRHSQIFDFLASAGLAGSMPIAVAFIFVVREMIHCIRDEEVKQYFFLSLIMLTILMFLNPTYYARAVYLSMFWGPSLVENRPLKIGNASKFDKKIIHNTRNHKWKEIVCANCYHYAGWFSKLWQYSPTICFAAIFNAVCESCGWYLAYKG